MADEADLGKVNGNGYYRTGKRRLARILLGVYLVILARMFILPPAPEVTNALSSYFAAFSGLVAVVVLGAYGLASYVNQILPAQKKEENGTPTGTV